MKERNDLTGDAVKINGVYLEDEIEDFITLSASGRESPLKEIISNENNGDGSKPIRTRYKEKEITVEYVMYSASFDDLNVKQG